MPDINFIVYLNLLFFGILGFGILMGFLRGFRNSLYAFIVKVAFFALFFLTLNSVVNTLWTMDLPGLANALAMINPDVSGASSFSEALPPLLESMLGDTLGETATHAEVIAFVTGLGIFIVKLIYTIFYFTVFYALWRLFFFILRIIVLGKSEKTMGSRGMGAAVGALNGALSIFVGLIMLGGLMSITESFVNILDDTGSSVNTTVYEPFSENGNGESVQVEELDEMVEQMGDMVSAYNSNPIVQAFYAIRVSDDTGTQTPLNVHLFDSVFSFDYRDNSISFRKELSVIAEITGTVYKSEYNETNNIADFTGQEVEKIFVTLSRSDLFISILPVAIEVGADYSDVDLQSILDEHEIDLYAIDWEQEIAQLGGIAMLLVDIVHHAGLAEEENTLETVSFDREMVEGFFDALSESDIVTLSAYVAIHPFIENLGEDTQAMITVPENLDWKEEFKAMGTIIGEIVGTGVTLGDMQSDDPMALFGILAEVDFTVMTNSKLISHAMVNIISGRGNVEMLDMLLTPDDIEWFNEDGYAIEGSELYLILDAFNVIADLAKDTSFDNGFDLNVIMELESLQLDKVLLSQVIEATMGNMMIEELGEVLTIPLSATKTVTVNGDLYTIVIGTEVTKIFEAVKVLEIVNFNDLAFDMSILSSLAIDDDANSHLLNHEKADQLFASDIIHATLSTLFFDMMNGENDQLVVPYKNMNNEDVQFVVDEIRYITRVEITNMLAAILALEINDFNELDSFNIDTIITHSTIILQSAIIHATVSDQLLDLPNQENNIVVVPHYKQIDGDDDESIRLEVGVGETDDDSGESKYYVFIDRDEIINLLEALNILGLTDISDFSGDLDVHALVEETGITPALNSAIMHATLSDKIIDMAEGDTPNELIILPTYAQDGKVIRLTAGDATENTETPYIIREELQALINALDILVDEEESFDEFSGVVTLEFLTEGNNKDVLLSSSIIQAIITDKMLTDTGGNLIVPDSVRLTMLDDTVYIENIEIKAIIDALDEFGLTDFDMITLAPSNLFNAESGYVYHIDESVSVHATISKFILDTAHNETVSAGAVGLIVPTTMRESIQVDALAQEQIEYNELVNLLAGIDQLDLVDFDSPIDAQVITSMDQLERETLLGSASIHVTVDNMLRGNPNIVIPDRITDFEYGLTYEVVEKAEIHDFMDAVIAVGGNEFTTASFPTTANDLAAMDETTRGIILDSVIVQRTLTPAVENAISDYQTFVDPTYEPDNTYYYDSDPNTFFTKPGIENVLIDIGLA